MKIIDLSSYEKLKVRPVNISDLQSNQPNRFEHIDPKSINWDELVPGDVCKIAGRPEKCINVWLVLDVQQMTSIFEGSYNYGCAAFVKPDPGFANHINYILLSDYYESWPKHSRVLFYNIVDIWRTDLDVSHIKTVDDVFDFYEKYNLYVL